MTNRISIVTVACLLAGCQQQVSDRETISTDKAPAAIGPYTQAIQIGNRLYLSGQIATDRIDPHCVKIDQAGNAITREQNVIMPDVADDRLNRQRHLGKWP